MTKFVTMPVIESSFSKLTIVKFKLQSTMRQELLDNLMVSFLEQELAVNADDDSVIQEFKKIKIINKHLLKLLSLYFNYWKKELIGS